MIGTDAPALDAALLARAASALGDADAVFVPAFDGGYALFEADDPARAAVLARAVAGGQLASFGPHEPSLAQVFREVIR